MKLKFFAAAILVLLTGCLPTPSTVTPIPPASPTAMVPPVATATPTLTFIETSTPLPGGVTSIPAVTATPTTKSSSYCSDSQVIGVIDTLKTSMFTADGSRLSSLVNPTLGMDVRFFRTGNVLTYSQEQAKYLFETTYQANWGSHPASGQTVVGAFHDVVVPELVKIFKQPYALYCNDLHHGGATYEPNWSYKGNFYTVYYAGTEPNGFLDWHSWVVGIDYVNNKPYIYAMTQFFWEP